MTTVTGGIQSKIATGATPPQKAPIAYQAASVQGGDSVSFRGAGKANTSNGILLTVGLGALGCCLAIPLALAGVAAWGIFKVVKAPFGFIKKAFSAVSGIAGKFTGKAAEAAA